ncbi:fungal-specific transcription factor domain-containing protein [Trichoderma evansii]
MNRPKRCWNCRGCDEVAIIPMTFGNDVLDVQQLLAKMIANSTKSSAIALRHALLALSFQFFVISTKAIQHQNQAIQYLQTAIDRSLPWEKDEALQSIAASMLLSVYEMENGESPLRWAIFFSGTKRIVDTIYIPGKAYEGDSAIMMDWIFYYYTMCKFSVLHWLRKDEQQTWIARQRKIMSKPPHSASQHTARKIPQANCLMQILPSWGCSLELLDILHEIFDNVFDRDSEQHKSPEHNARLKVLEQRLHHLTQCEQSDISRVDRSPSYNTQIAEFYRLAALLYIQRVARSNSRDTPHVINLVAKAYRVLELMARCDRPWPLFVIALEASTEDERRLVLVTIETLLERKPLRKWTMLRTMIQQAWAQSDLGKTNSLDALLLYQSVINAQRIPPMFI